MKIKTIKQARKKLDKLWRTPKGNEVCAICATLPKEERKVAKRLNPHHVIPRRVSCLRWDPRNRLWLCPTHHTLGKFSAHKNPLWFAKWYKEHYPEDYEYLTKKQHEIVKYRITELRELIRSFESSAA